MSAMNRFKISFKKRLFLVSTVAITLFFNSSCFAASRQDEKASAFQYMKKLKRNN